MKPEDVYAADTVERGVWWDWSNVEEVIEILGDSMNIHPTDLDLDEAARLEDSRIGIEVKAFRSVDGDRWTRLAAISFDGKPFAVTQSGGRGGRDHVSHFTTDDAARAEALRHLLGFHELLKASRERSLDAGRDVPELGEFHNAKAVRAGDGKLELREAGTFSEAGHRIFEPATFEAEISAFFDGAGGVTKSPMGFDKPEAREALVEAAAKAVPDGIERLRVNGINNADDPQRAEWVALALRDPEGEVFAVSQDAVMLTSIGPRGFAMARPARVRDPEMLDDLDFDANTVRFEDADPPKP